MISIDANVASVIVKEFGHRPPSVQFQQML